MINIVVNSDPKYLINKLTLQAAVIEILKQNGIWGNIEVGISIVSDRSMHEINRKYRGINATTNILSFALDDHSDSVPLQHIPRVGFVKPPDRVVRLGDILISYPQVEKDAALEGVTI